MAIPLPPRRRRRSVHSPALQEEMEEVSIPPALKEEMTEEEGDEIVMKGLPFSPSLKEEMRWHPFPPSQGHSYPLSDIPPSIGGKSWPSLPFKESGTRMKPLEGAGSPSIAKLVLELILNFHKFVLLLR